MSYKNTILGALGPALLLLCTLPAQGQAPQGTPAQNITLADHHETGRSTTGPVPDLSQDQVVMNSYAGPNINPTSTVRPKGTTSDTNKLTTATKTSSQIPQVHAVTTIQVLPPGYKKDKTTLTTLSRSVAAASTYWSKQTSDVVTFKVTKQYGWTSISVDCSDSSKIFAAAAKKAAWTPGPNKHLVIYTPEGKACRNAVGMLGSINTGGESRLSGVRAAQVDMVAHELGHNLGLAHSNTLNCGSVDPYLRNNKTFSTRCQIREYMDLYDTMGISWGTMGNLNGSHLSQMAGMGTNANNVQYLSPSLTATTTRLTIPALSSMRPGRVVELSNANKQGTHTIEFRTAAGLDAWLGSKRTNQGLDYGVLIRRNFQATPWAPTSTHPYASYLLDTSPSPQARWATDTTRGLAPGKSVTLSSGAVVKVISINVNNAVVDVTYPTRR